MPKYVYKCDCCTAHFEIYHGMNESQEECIYCDAQSPHRVPQMPFLKRSVESKGGKVGDETKAAIEANREVLKDMKKRNNKDRYKDDY
tara:strand:+ start:195 stop:458 length:264 start_codon:yes stop_codon:yes gene_type:complete